MSFVLSDAFHNVRDFDVYGGKIYFVSYNGTGNLYSVYPDGTNLEVVINNIGNLFAIAADDGYIFLAVTEEIYRSNIDGSNLVSILTLTGSVMNMYTHNRKLYWTELGDAGLLKRASYDGSHVDVIVYAANVPVSLPRVIRPGAVSMVADFAAKKVYTLQQFSLTRIYPTDTDLYLTRIGSRIVQSNFDGTDAKTVLRFGEQENVQLPVDTSISTFLRNCPCHFVERMMDP